LERQRLARLREQVEGLVQEARQAIDRRDNRSAKTRLLDALARIQNEPALYDQTLTILGWLHPTFEDDEQQRLNWKQRNQPPLFDELRDEAFLHSVLLAPHQTETVEPARKAIERALEFTVADDPAWRQEQEQLVLLDADLVLRTGGAAEALALLDQAK